jgi:hypothetical protein
MRPLAVPLLALALGVSAAACGNTPKPVPLTLDWPAQASSDYDDITEKWMRSTSMRAAYQEVLELSAVLKSPEWRAAYAKRDAAHRGLSGEALQQRMVQAQAELEGPWELELLVTTWDRRENDLDRGKRSVWRVVLVDDNGTEIEPLEIIKDKRPRFTITADYPSFGDFATAYVARFPRTANILGPGVKQVRLRMSSSRGGVEVVWVGAQ